MRALYWDGHELSLNLSYPTPQTSKIEDRESKIVGATGSRLDSADDRTALVKVHLAGICSTDLQIFKGYMDFQGVPGHEFVGSVVEGPRELVHKRVVGEINFACGRCDYCNRGLGRHCPSRSVMGILNADGAFAEFVVRPGWPICTWCQKTLAMKRPSLQNLSRPLLKFRSKLQLNPSDEVLVLGDGKLGNLCTQVLRLTGAHVTALGKHEDKLKLIKRSGVRTILLSDWQPKQFDVVDRSHGFPFRPGTGDARGSPTRHTGAKKHHRRRAPSFACAVGDQRDYRRGFSLRSVHACISCSARKECFRDTTDREDLPPYGRY